MDQNLTTMTTTGLLPPSTSTAIDSAQMEERLEQYQRRQSQDQNQPFSQTHSQSLASPNPHGQSQPQPQSQSQLVDETPSLSDLSLFLPQDTVQRILGTTTTTKDDVDRFGSGNLTRSQGRNQGRQKLSHQEARAQIMEYHHESLAKSMGKKNGADGCGDERVVDQCRDGDERGKRRRRDSDAELELGRHGSGKAYRFKQSTASAGPPTSTTPSSAVPWSSSSSTTNNNNSISRNTPIDERLENWGFDTNGFSSGGSTSAKVNTSNDLGSLAYELAAIPSETVGSLGREDEDEDEDVEIIPPPGELTTGSSTSTPGASSSSLSQSASSSSPQKLLVRQATFVPGGWAVPPRVLLVDDDAVIRKLSSRFLKIFGCTTDVAVDGIGAVTKMNLEKYDLVLMVRS